MSTAVLLLLLGMMCMCCAVALIVLLNLAKNKKKTPGTTPGTTPGPTPPTGTTPPTGPTPPTGSGGGGNGSQLRGEDDLWRQVQANVAELVAHVRKKYGNTEYGRSLIQNYRVVNKLRGGGASGMALGGEIQVNVGGNYFRNLPDVNNTITHELGHVAAIPLGGTGHSEGWKKVFLWLTNIAVNDLGWTIGMGALDCNSYKICATDKTPCPRCLWTRGMTPATWRQQQQEAPRMPSGLLG